MRALLLGAGILLIAGSSANAKDDLAAKHRRATLEFSKEPAEPLPAYPRTRVIVEYLGRDDLRTLAAGVCAGLPASGCLDLVSRVNEFIDHILPHSDGAAPADSTGE